MSLHAFPSVAAFGHQPTPDDVDVVGIDLPVGRLTAYRVVPLGPAINTPGFDDPAVQVPIGPPLAAPTPKGPSQGELF